MNVATLQKFETELVILAVEMFAVIVFVEITIASVFVEKLTVATVTAGKLPVVTGLDLSDYWERTLVKLFVYQIFASLIAEFETAMN